MKPILNKIYHYFDDGKIRPSRRGEVVIKEIIPFNEIDSETLAMWEKEVEICDWLYEKTTDYFIKAQEVGSTNDEMVFVRVKNNGWFSLGFCAGRLDIDGTLNEICEKQFEPKEETSWFNEYQSVEDYIINRVGDKFIESTPEKYKTESEATISLLESNWKTNGGYNEEEMYFIKRCIKVYWEYYANREHPDNQDDWNISQNILNYGK